MNAPTRWVAGLAACVLLAQAAPAPAQSLSYSGSLGYASDRYIFTETTNTWSLHNGLYLTAGRVRLSAGMPLVWQDSWALTYIGGELVPTAGPDHEALQQREPGQAIPMTRARKGQTGTSGNGGPGGRNFAVVAAIDSVTEPGDFEMHIADPLFSAGVDVYRGWGALRSIALNASVKPPIADEAVGMSTGAWDYSGGASIAVAGGPLLLYADVAYWSYGDMSDLELQDGVAFSAGAGMPLGSKATLMASYSTAQAIIKNMEAPASVALLASYSVGERTSLNAGASFGLSESVSDAAFFMGWSLKLIGAPTDIAAR